jgi:hypothetical protein
MHITLDAFTKTHPTSIAGNWAAFAKQPADVRETVYVILAVCLIALIALTRSILRGRG